MIILLIVVINYIGGIIVGKVISMFNDKNRLEKEKTEEQEQDALYGEAWFILANAYNREDRWKAELDIRDAVDLYESYNTTKREKYMFKTFQRAVCNFINDNKNYKRGQRKEPRWS